MLERRGRKGMWMYGMPEMHGKPNQHIGRKAGIRIVIMLLTTENTVTHSPIAHNGNLEL